MWCFSLVSCLLFLLLFLKNLPFKSSPWTQQNGLCAGLWYIFNHCNTQLTPVHETEHASPSGHCANGAVCSGPSAVTEKIFEVTSLKELLLEFQEITDRWRPSAFKNEITLQKHLWTCGKEFLVANVCRNWLRLASPSQDSLLVPYNIIHLLLWKSTHWSVKLLNPSIPKAHLKF